MMWTRWRGLQAGRQAGREKGLSGAGLEELRWEDEQKAEQNGAEDFCTRQQREGNGGKG